MTWVKSENSKISKSEAVGFIHDVNQCKKTCMGHPNCTGIDYHHSTRVIANYLDFKKSLLSGLIPPFLRPPQCYFAYRKSGLKTAKGIAHYDLIRNCPTGEKRTCI